MYNIWLWLAKYYLVIYYHKVAGTATILDFKWSEAVEHPGSRFQDVLL